MAELMEVLASAFIKSFQVSTSFISLSRKFCDKQNMLVITRLASP